MSLHRVMATVSSDSNSASQRCSSSPSPPKPVKPARTCRGWPWRSTASLNAAKLARTVSRPAALLICKADKPGVSPSATMRPVASASAQRVWVPPASMPRPSTPVAPALLILFPQHGQRRAFLAQAVYGVDEHGRWGAQLGIVRQQHVIGGGGDDGESPLAAIARPDGVAAVARTGGELQADAGMLALGPHLGRARRTGHAFAQPGRGGHQGRSRVVALFELVADALAVFHQAHHAEVHVAARAGTAAGDADLLHDFTGRIVLGGRAYAAGEQARPDVAVLRVFCDPIVQQHIVGLRLLLDGPIQLGRKIIEPAVLQPQLGVRVQLVVLAEAGDAFRTQGRLAQAKRADAEQHPGFFAVDARIKVLDQLVDV